MTAKTSSGIWSLLKFVQEQRYAEDFVAGRLYMNTLEYFRGLENSSDGRADPLEGISAHYQGDQIRLTVGDLEIPGSEFAAPLTVAMDRLSSTNLLCMYAVSSGTADSFEALNEWLQPSPLCREMGPLLVAVTNVTEFQRRVTNAIRRNRFRGGMGLVEYYDEQKYSGQFPRPLFQKRSSYAWQREYRVAVERDVVEASPFVLEVGALNDICQVLTTQIFLEQPPRAVPKSAC